jgi:hypothetical protein
MPRRLQISGQRFGRLTAIEPQGLDRHGKVTWLFVAIVVARRSLLLLT